MRLGFVCEWDADRHQTWSHIPLNLLNAISRQRDVIDIPVRRHRPAVKVPRRWRDARRNRVVETRARRAGADLLMQIHDLAVTRLPYWSYNDVTWALVRQWDGQVGLGPLSDGFIRHRESRQAKFFESAAGSFVFSEWAARSVRPQTASPVVVVPPGIGQRAPTAPRPPRAARRRLLFVGRDFERKGGQQVLDAFGLLRTDDARLELEVVGPAAWPIAGSPPDGVRFHGPVAGRELASLFNAADLFVMPSHFEAFGIAFIEALAAGLPCIGRDTCAMPEIITADRGRLVGSTNPEHLADAIRAALDDDALHEQVAREAPAVAAHYSWDRVAAQMLSAMSGHGSSPPEG